LLPLSWYAELAGKVGALRDSDLGNPCIDSGSVAHLPYHVRRRVIAAAFSRVHPKFKTPGFATLLPGTAAAIIGGLLPVNILGELVSFGTLTAFLVVCIGVLILRRTRPDLERPFRVPAAPLVCVLGALSCAYLICKLPTDTWIRAAVWTAVGLAIYFSYSYRHSVLNGPR
jgi:APA family basic amino acid/polyamine antiporter